MSTSAQDQLREVLKKLYVRRHIVDYHSTLAVLDAVVAEARAEGEIAGLEWVMKVEDDGYGMLPVDAGTVCARLEELKGK